MRKRRIKLFTLISINVILLVFAFLLNISKASTNYLTYDGNKNSASAINNFINECYSSGKDAYFESGTYRLDGNINLKNGVSLISDEADPAIFKGDTSQRNIYTTTGNTKNIEISGFVFDNVTIYIRHTGCDNVIVQNNIFLNAKDVNPSVDGGVTEDTGYYVLIKSSTATIKSNIFLRDKLSLGRGIGLYKTSDCLIEDNYFGIVEDLEKSIVSSSVKAKKTLIDTLVTTDSNQGYFMTAINVISQDTNVVIKSNHISLNTDITEGSNANNDQAYHRDHLIYAKEFDGLDIVGNYFKGSNKNADGGIKVRNGQNVNIYKNVIVDNQILLYVQDGSSMGYLKNVFVDSNILINNFYIDTVVQAGTSNFKNKELSEGWLIYLRSYNASYQLSDITITNNMATSQRLANEQIRIHRRTTSTECSMPTNLNVQNNTNILNEKFKFFDYASTNTIENIDYSNGTLYTCDMSKYSSIDVEKLANLYEELTVTDGVIDEIEGATLYLFETEYGLYNGQKLAEGNYLVGIVRKSTTYVMVEGVKSNSISLENITLANVKVRNQKVANYGFVDNYNILKSESIFLDFKGESINYSSKDESIATVSSTGEVKGINFGTTTIEIIVDGIVYQVVVNVAANYTDFNFDDQSADLSVESERKGVGILSINDNATVSWDSIQSSDALKITNKTLSSSVTTAEIELRNTTTNLFNNNGNPDRNIHLSTRILKQNAKVFAIYLGMGGSTGTFQALYFNTNKISYKYPTTSSNVNYTFENDVWYDLDFYFIDNKTSSDVVYVFINGELIIHTNVETELASYMTNVKFQVQNPANTTENSVLYIDRLSVKEFIPLNDAVINDMELAPNSTFDLEGKIKFNLGANVNNDFNKYSITINNDYITYNEQTKKFTVAEVTKHSTTSITLKFANGVETSFDVNIIIPPHEHEMNFVKGVDPTCTEKGTKPYYYCEICDVYYDVDRITLLDTIEIDKLGHDYGDFISDNEGGHSQVCGNDESHIIVEECEIIWKTYEVEPSEFEDGIQNGECEKCSYKTTRVVAATHQCDFEDDFTIDVPKTCTKNGSKSKHCKSEHCDQVIEVTVIPYGHELSDVDAKEPTCTNPGNIAYKHCSLCLGDFDNNGVKLGNVLIEPEHTLIDITAKNPTCTVDGNIAYKHCEICGKNLDKDNKELLSVVIPAAHEFEHVEAVDPTCNFNGNVEYNFCTVCEGSFDMNNNQLANVIIPASHKFKVVNAKEATCTKNGNIAYKYCEVCNKKYNMSNNEVTDVVIKGEHELYEINHKFPTCTETGVVYHQICLVCEGKFDYDGNQLTDVTIPKLEHSYSTKWSKDENKHWHECEECGTKLDEANHKFEEKIIKEPTNTEDGLLEKSCICGEKKTEVIKAKSPIAKGCLGSISSMLICVISIMGVIVLYKKKENKND